MTNTTKQGRPTALTSENFISLFTKGVEVPREDIVSLHALKAGIDKMTIRDCVVRCKHTRIKGYANNRGPGKIVPATISRIAKNLKPHGLGHFTLCEDGTIVDSHNRIGALCLRAQQGDMQTSDWDAEIPISVVTQKHFMEVYKLLGDNNRHGINEHLSNPDLLLGSCIVGKDGLYSYFDEVDCNEEELKILKSTGSLTIIANIMTAIHLVNDKKVPESIGDIKSYCEVYKVRQFMKVMASDLKGSECNIVHPRDYLTLAKACHYYAQFRIALRIAKANDDGLPSIQKLSNNKGLMGLIVSDIVFNSEDRKLTSTTPKVLAKRLLHRASNIEERLAHILGSDNKSSLVAARYIIRIAERPIDGE